MAGLTKLAFRIDWHKLAARILGRMTIDTSGEAVLDRANSLVHCLVTIMLQEIKMITAHDLDGLNALPALGRGNLGRCHIAVPNQRSPQNRAAEDQAYDPRLTQLIAPNARHGNLKVTPPFPCRCNPLGRRRRKYGNRCTSNSRYPRTGQLSTDLS